MVAMGVRGGKIHTFGTYLKRKCKNVRFIKDSCPF